MEVYLQAFVNFEQNNQAKLLPIVEFAYNIAKNASIGNMPFELNYGYYFCIFFGEDTNSCSLLKTANKLLAKLYKHMTVCQGNFYHTYEFEKQAYNKGVKPKSYDPNKKVWLNNKYIKTKQKQKLKAKFFGLFQMLHLVSKQVYKLKLLKQ